MQTIERIECTELDLESPVGPLRLVAHAGALVAVEFGPGHARAGGGARVDPASRAAPRVEDRKVLQEATRQLRAYFAGELRRFELPLRPVGPLRDDGSIREATAFQRRTWRALQRIPFGQTRSYADVARSIGNVKAVRAVGAANGRNPLSIVIPCHRVIGGDGGLVGYGGGLAIKRRLLELEGVL